MCTPRRMSCYCNLNAHAPVPPPPPFPPYSSQLRTSFFTAPRISLLCFASLSFPLFHISWPRTKRALDQKRPCRRRCRSRSRSRSMHVVDPFRRRAEYMLLRRASRHVSASPFSPMQIHATYMRVARSSVLAYCHLRFQYVE